MSGRAARLVAIALLAPALAWVLSGAPWPAAATEPVLEPPRAATPGIAERRLGVMGTSLEITVEAGDRATALAASEVAVRALEDAEARLSTWRSDTELARLNAAPVGRWQPLSPVLAGELAAAARCARDTGGAFDPTIGALVAAWGLRSGGRQPADAEIERARAASGLAGLGLAADRAARRRAGLVLEEGAFGKGAGLAAALAALDGLEDDSRPHRALIDLGGQVAVWGAGGAWQVEVAHPERRGEVAGSLVIEHGSLATSGTSERGRHLLDPRTGRPAAGFGSLTVWAADPLLADCLSTGLYVMGPEAALAWAHDRPGIEVLVLETTPAGLVARSTPGLTGRFSPRPAATPSEVGGAK